MPIDIEQLVAHMEWAARNGLSEFAITAGQTRVTITRRSGAGAAPASQSDAKAATAPDHDAVLSPLAGLCHLSPEPGAPPFVAVGDRVEAGRTLCLIEAMKVMTSIPAPRAGTVEAILVSDGTSIGSGAPLVRLGP